MKKAAKFQKHREDGGKIKLVREVPERINNLSRPKGLQPPKVTGILIWDSQRYGTAIRTTYKNKECYISADGKHYINLN